jgi:acyl carrier protein
MTMNDSCLSVADVECALRRCPHVREAVVVEEASAANPRLVAYVVMPKEWAWSVRTLRAMLLAELPASSLPAAFVAIDAMPPTAGGEIDRAALAAAPGEAIDFGSAFVAPQTASERRLAEIWNDIFETDAVGIDDDFFGIGGDSLRGLEIVSRIAEAFGVDADVDAVFRRPTIRALADALDRGSVTRDSHD